MDKALWINKGVQRQKQISFGNDNQKGNGSGQGQRAGQGG